MLLVCCGAGVRPLAAQTTFGTLSNFDVFNTTGQDCHGFEIELDGISSSNVTFTFGAPYERYGDPKIVDFAGGVFVRYESPYDTVNQVFTQGTPQAPSVITPTGGHACWTGGAPGYLTAGCEHFGVGMNANPTATVYRWLVADPATAGALQPAGTKVSIPAPVWNVQPPPVVGQPPVVQAVLPAEPPEVNQQFGDAQWVKVFVTELPDAVELHHLVTDDPVVPAEPAETETEWTILQSGPGGGNNELVSEGQVGNGKQAVVRRYEFYEYTGAYDPESHEALCASQGCSAPQASELGNYIGAQMAAVNLGPAVPTETPTPAVTDTATPVVTETPTPTPPTVLVGDCGGHGKVTVADIVILVNIVLGTAQPSACAAGIPSGSQVNVALIIQAVRNALSA